MGALGTGKTYLGKRLSSAMHIPLYDLDDIQWTRKFDKYRPLEQRKKLIHRITRKTKWVVSGVPFPWTGIAIHRAQQIIILQESFWLQTLRIILRGIKMSVNDAVSLGAILGALRHNYTGFHKKNGYGAKTIERIKKEHQEKVTMISSKSEMRRFLEEE